MRLPYTTFRLYANLLNDSAGSRVRPRTWPGRALRRAHHPDALARHKRDAAPLDTVGLAAHAAELGALEHALDHDLHLELRERRAEAATRAAAERHPRVGVGRVLLEEALGAELARLRVAVAAAVDHADRRGDLGAWRPGVAAELERLAAHDAADARHDGTEAERLLHDGVDVGVVAIGVGERGLQLLHRARGLEQEVERPRQAGRGGLVPGHEQRHELVA